MRCPGCNKFPGLDFEDPEVNSIEINEDGTVTIDVHLVRNSSCCGEEMKTADLNIEVEPSEEVTKHLEKKLKGDKTHELSVEEKDVEQVEEGGGRYAKSYFGATVHFTIGCSCDEKWEAEGEGTDKVAASEMEESF